MGLKLRLWIRPTLELAAPPSAAPGSEAEVCTTPPAAAPSGKTADAPAAAAAEERSTGVSTNRDADGGPGKPVTEGGLGYSCIAEVRTVETILRGERAA